MKIKELTGRTAGAETTERGPGTGAAGGTTTAEGAGRFGAGSIARMIGMAAGMIRGRG